MSRKIVIANQKGGVAKTTTAVNLGIGLARAGKRVLLIDNDPQGSLTEALGYQEPDSLEIPVGVELEYYADKKITCMVVDDRKVSFNGDIMRSYRCCENCFRKNNWNSRSKIL